MPLDIYSTHIELSPYLKGDIPALEDMYTSIDRFSQTERPCGYILEQNRLFLPRGTPISKLEMWSDQTANYDTQPDPIAKMGRKHHGLYDPRNELQEMSIHFLLTNDNPQLALNLPTGFGKALANSTELPTPDGTCCMGDIKVGDKVFGSDGKPCNVLGVYPQGERDIYRVTFEDDRVSFCDVSHLWNVSINRGPFETLTLDEINDSFRVGAKCSIPLMSAPVEYPTSAGPSEFPKTVARTVIKHPENGIPEAYMRGRVLTRLRLFRDIVDSGATISGTNLLFPSTSKKLLSQLCCLARGFGHRANVRRNSMVAQGDILVVGDTRATKLDITDIRFERTEHATCIMVDSSDHLFITEDFIVTHNTFCVVNAATAIGQRCLVVTPDSFLKQQWINTCRKMFDYHDQDVRNIAGSEVMSMIVDGSLPPADVYCINHQTLRSYLSQFGPEMFHDFFRKLKIGVKVYDESHLEFGNILLIDSFSATARTWYLTATFDRSDKSESTCFKRAFSSVTAFGEEEGQKVVEKHVLYHVVNINSHPDQRSLREVIKFNGMTAATYGRYAFLLDRNETAYRTVLALLKKVKDLEGKILIFIPLIEAVDAIAKKLKVDFPERSVGVYHSKIDAGEKESTLKKDIIVSTIKSCGTGKDIPGLRVVINCEPLASKVQAQQLIGRLRPYGKDLMTYFFDVVDIGIPAINWWFRARYRKIQTLVKATIYVDRTKCDM